MIKFLAQALTVLPFVLLPEMAEELDRSKAPKPGPAPEIRIGDYQSFLLENGLQVFVVENHKLPKVSFLFQFEYLQPLQREATGYVEAVGKLLRHGTTSRTKTELDEAIDFIGATFQTYPTGLFASSLKKHQETLMKLISDVLRNPNFTEVELEKIKKQMLSALESEKDDPRIISENISALLLHPSQHPYGEIQTETSIKNIDLQMCRDFHKLYLKPNLSYLAIVGDITLSEAKPLVEKYLGAWKSGHLEEKPYSQPKKPHHRPIAIVNKEGATQTALQITNVTKLRHDDAELIPALVMNTLLGGGFFRLYQNLREENGYTYGAYSTLRPDPITAQFSAYASVRNEVTTASVKECLYELRRIREEPVSEQELDRVKNFMTGQFARSLEDPQTIARFAINTARYKLDSSFYHDYLKNLSKVTAEDVRAAAQKHISPDQACIVAVGDAKDLGKALKGFGIINFYDSSGNSYDPSPFEIPKNLTAKAVLQNYVKAAGGLKKLKAVKDLTIESTFFMDAKEIELTSLTRKPNLSRTTGRWANQVIFERIFDGKEGTVEQYHNKKPLEGPHLENARIQSYLFPELHYRALKAIVKLIGSEKVNGEDAYVLEVSYPNGIKVYNSYDVGSGLKVKRKVIQSKEVGNITQISEYYDFRETDGIVFPFLTLQSLGPRFMKIKTKKIQLNQNLPKDIFK